MGVPIRLGGGWDSPGRLLRGQGGLVVVSPGLVGGWECPVRLVMGSGTVLGFIPGWVVCVVVWVSPLGWEGSWGRTIRAGSGTVPGFLTGWVGDKGVGALND